MLVLLAAVDLPLTPSPLPSPPQMASNVGLDRLRDQMKLLKRMCRLRTMMSWKQQRIQFEQELSIAYRGSMGALQQEAEALEVGVGWVGGGRRQRHWRWGSAGGGTG